MFVRALFLLLLALNLGAACWLVFARPPNTAGAPTVDPGIPKLVLLSERDGGMTANAELTEAPETKADLAHDQCRSVGPFPTQADLRAAMNALTPLTKRIQFHETHTQQARGYWVYLPATASREQALSSARVLQAKGVHDYYVVTAGDQQNTISLGLFRDPGNAERRRAEIAALGFAAQTNARTEDLPAYWLDFATVGDGVFDWRSHLVAARELREEPIACF